MRFIAFLLAGLILLLLSLAIRAVVDLRYQRLDEKDNLELHIEALGGLWKFYFQVPTIQLEWEKEEGPELELEQRGLAETGEKMKGKTDLKVRYFRPYFFYKLWPKIPSFLYHLQRIKAKFYRGIHCTKIDWQVGIGYKDPDRTAIAAGALWGALGLSIARLYRQVTVKVLKPNLLVKPEFKKEGFSCDIHCIFHLRLGHIIFVGIELLRTFIRGQRGKTHGESPN
ncbi:MAG: DUF2953 domain-containing protein [Desulfitobacterium hafniense]|nr:DUF2953 domain-containing protein [Desulfitobacterium hafniense]